MEHIGKNSSLAGAKLAVSAEQAASSAHHAINQLSEVARPAVSRAASKAHHLVDRISGSTSRVAQQLEKKAVRLKDIEQRIVGVSSSYVRAHPLKSAGIALAAGFLISRLVSSSNGSSKLSGVKQAEPKGAESGETTTIGEEWY